MQDIPMQIDRLEKIIDYLHIRSDGQLGTSDNLTKQSLQALFYLQGLRYDIEVLLQTRGEQQ